MVVDLGQETFHCNNSKASVNAIYVSFKKMHGDCLCFLNSREILWCQGFFKAAVDYCILFCSLCNCFEERNFRNDYDSFCT